MTPAGYFFIGLVIGLGIGFNWETIRERKDMNKK